MPLLKTNYAIQDLVMVTLIVSVCLALGSVVGAPVTLGLNLAVGGGIYASLFRTRNYDAAWRVFCVWIAVQPILSLALRRLNPDATVLPLSGSAELPYGPVSIWLFNWTLAAIAWNRLFRRGKEDEYRAEVAGLTIIAIGVVGMATIFSLRYWLEFGNILSLNLAVLIGVYSVLVCTRNFHGAWRAYCAWMAAQPVLWLMLRPQFEQLGEVFERFVGNLNFGKLMMWLFVWAIAASIGKRLLHRCGEDEKRPVLAAMVILGACGASLAIYLHLSMDCD